MDDDSETILLNGDDGGRPGGSHGRAQRGQGEFKAGDVIGHFTIRELIGEGGFGEVYLAAQSKPVKRRVALKIIKPGMDSRSVLARFEAERQALAVMDHSCIAKVFNGGTTEQGRAYFVMELVKGAPITEFCDAQRLSIDDRLELFIRVCDAVQHAHQKGIIHRDLKPSNILVGYDGDGKATPKVIDFGVAKALNQKLSEVTIFTERGQLIGTPEYMSPEQAEMSGLDIDTRSDVYSLGVLLYVLLTGALPFDPKTLRAAGFAEIQRIIREVDPPKPSTRLSTVMQSDHKRELATRIIRSRNTDARSLSGILRRDLDWVVMRCLEKDRERRYETANALAMELQRYLKSEPVLAGPPSVGYRLRKYVGRHRASVSVGALVSVVLVAATVVSIVFAIIAERERERTALALGERDEALEAEIQRSEELQIVADFQSAQLGEIDAAIMGARLRRALIDAAPESRSETVQESIAGINFTDLALQVLEKNIFAQSLDAIDTQFADQPLVQAQLLQTIASLLRELGLLELAIDPAERTLAIRRVHLGNEHPETLDSMNNLGVLLSDQGEYSDAEAYIREALETSLRVSSEEDPATLAAMHNMGALLINQSRYTDQNRLAEAEVYLQQALEGRRRVLGDEHPDTLTSINETGALFSAQDQFLKAKEYFREALEGRRRALGHEDPQTLGSINDLATVLLEQGRFAEAEVYYREVLDAIRSALGDEHPKTLTLLHNIGSLLRLQGKRSEAELYLQEALDGRQLALGNEHQQTLVSAMSLALLLFELGKHEEALIHWSEAVEIARAKFGEEHWTYGNMLIQRAEVRKALGRYEEAAAEMTEGYAIILLRVDSEHVQAKNVAGYIADLYEKWNEVEPGKGYDATAAEWRAKSWPAMEASPDQAFDTQEESVGD